jgi:LysM repeat protein
MKRIFATATLLALLPALTPLRAQVDPATAAAEREQAEERHRSVVSRLERMEESIAAFQKTATSLREEVRKVKDEIDRLKNKNEAAATQESIKRLADSIEAVDKKRAADYEKNLRAFEEMKKAILERPSSSGRTPVPPATTGQDPTKPPAGTPGKQAGWNYTIKNGDTLAGIASALRKQGINVTSSQIEKANEGVNWNRLKIGQIIFIPKP